MGTLKNAPVWSQKAGDRVGDILSAFGWDKKTTPEQLQAAIALAEHERQTYLVDRHDEIAAGFGDLLERLCAALEQGR